MSVIVNGKAYDWGDITVSLLPLSPVLISCSSISFDESLEASPIYGKGRAPIAYGTGKWSSSGKISLLKTEFDLLQKSAQSAGGILNMDPRVTTINITYGPNLQGVIPISTTTLMGVRFTKISSNASSNDKDLKIDLDFIVLSNILRDGIPSRSATIKG
ncbi:MAG: hypothetical protein ACRC9L_02060 [Brevinema sp.]